MIGRPGSSDTAAGTSYDRNGASPQSCAPCSQQPADHLCVRIPCVPSAAADSCTSRPEQRTGTKTTRCLSLVAYEAWVREVADTIIIQNKPGRGLLYFSATNWSVSPAPSMYPSLADQIEQPVARRNPACFKKSSRSQPKW